MWKPALHGLLGLLGRSPASTLAAPSQLDAIQDSMLEALGEAGAARFPKIVRRVTEAGDDVHALWYLRGDLMAALAALHGESIARELLEEISEQFEEFGLSTRPSPLGRH